MVKHLLLLMTLLTLWVQGCAKKQEASEDQISTVTTACGLDMVLVPGGTFIMGKDGGSADEAPAHRVTVSAFAMDRYEVNQTVYEALVMADPSHFKSPDRPVEQVRWMDAVLFCNARSSAEGLEPCYDEMTFDCSFEANGYRLPTEAQWEYACRAGSKGDFCFGDSAAKLTDYASFSKNSNKKTSLAGSGKPNVFGLYDMHGNVYEWVHDVYDPRYYQNGPEQDPTGPAQGKERVLRGGAWNSEASSCRSSYRSSDTPGTADACFAQDTYGFRCARALTEQELALVK